MEKKTEESQSLLEWFVLRVTYQREMIAKEVLDSMNIANFLPTEKVRRRTPQGKMVTVVQPAIHNYLFVYTTKEQVDELKQFKLPYLRYVMKTDNGVRSILTVPDYQMQNFIAIAGNEEEQAEFLNVDDLQIAQGDKVRILGGPFAGVEGIYMRTSNTRSKRVVVQVAGMFAVATTTLPVSLVEKI